MKSINNFIQEKLNKINSKNSGIAYSCQPSNYDKLRNILKERLEDDKNANLNDIDVSKITDMTDLFMDLDPYNIDISKWDVSNVENMNSMFFKCANFNCDLSKWDVSNVTDMSYMFVYCRNFNSDISEWDVSNIEDMYSMFYGCPLEKNPPKWYK